MAASSKGSGSSLSARVKALGLESVPIGLVMAFGCLEDAGLFSSGEYALLLVLLSRRLRRSRKAISAAMSAPAKAQPMPTPAAAPFEMPLEEEWWTSGVELELCLGTGTVLEALLSLSIILGDELAAVGLAAVAPIAVELVVAGLIVAVLLGVDVLLEGPVADGSTVESLSVGANVVVDKKLLISGWFSSITARWGSRKIEWAPGAAVGTPGAIVAWEPAGTVTVTVRPKAKVWPRMIITDSLAVHNCPSKPITGLVTVDVTNGVGMLTRDPDFHQYRIIRISVSNRPQGKGTVYWRLSLGASMRGRERWIHNKFKSDNDRTREGCLAWQHWNAICSAANRTSSWTVPWSFSYLSSRLATPFGGPKRQKSISTPQRRFTRPRAVASEQKATKEVQWAVSTCLLPPEAIPWSITRRMPFSVEPTSRHNLTNRTSAILGQKHRALYSQYRAARLCTVLLLANLPKILQILRAALKLPPSNKMPPDRHSPGA